MLSKFDPKTSVMLVGCSISNIVVIAVAVAVVITVVVVAVAAVTVVAVADAAVVVVLNEELPNRKFPLEKS